MSRYEPLVSVWLGAVSGVTKLLLSTTAAIANGDSAEYNMAEKRTVFNLLTEKSNGRRKPESERVRQTSTYTAEVSDRGTAGDNQGPV